MFEPIKHDFEEAASKTVDAISELEHEIFLAGRMASSAGNFVLRAHLWQLIDRSKDIQLILERLQDDCATLLKLDNRKANSAWKPEHHPHEHNPVVIDLLELIDRQERRVSLGIEHLYQTGAIMLDQMSFAIAYVFNLANPEKLEFARLISACENQNGQNFERDLSAAIFVPQDKQLLQLYIHLRTYRNKFIVHHAFPWQRATMRNSQGQYCMMISLPPGWIDSASISQDEHYWKVLSGEMFFHRVVERFASFPHADRQRIVEIACRTGFNSMDYASLGFLLLEVAKKTCELMTKEVTNNFARISLRQNK